jgi:hypothetical protein
VVSRTPPRRRGGGGEDEEGAGEVEAQVEDVLVARSSLRRAAEGADRLLVDHFWKNMWVLLVTTCIFFCERTSNSASECHAR